MNAKRKRGRPPLNRDKLLRRVHRFTLLWIQVHSLSAEYHHKGKRAPYASALETVAAAQRPPMSAETLRKLLWRGLKDAPADVRALLTPELPNYREVYEMHEGRAMWEAAAAARKKAN